MTFATRSFLLIEHHFTQTITLTVTKRYPQKDVLCVKHNVSNGKEYKRIQDIIVRNATRDYEYYVLKYITQEVHFNANSSFYWTKKGLNIPRAISREKMH